LGQRLTRRRLLNLLGWVCRPDFYFRQSQPRKQRPDPFVVLLRLKVERPGNGWRDLYFLNQSVWDFMPASIGPDKKNALNVNL